MTDPIAPLIEDFRRKNMLRNARRIAPLLRSLLTATVTLSGAAVAMGTLVACADENDPATHVKKLDDPATRPAAVKRLIQFFEDAMTRDDGDREGKTVKPLFDTIIEPLTAICVSGDLDERTNANLIKFLADARDPRAEACLVKTLKEYRVDANEEDVRWVVRAVGTMKLKAAGDALLEVFIKLRPSKPKASAIYQDVNDAIIKLADASWEPKLIGLLERPINDRKDGGVLKDEMFWQITAAEVLGNLKSTAAVKPLIKVILSPMKAEAGNTALNALIKIGKPSIDAAVGLLKGEDKDLLEYSKLENLKAAAGPDGKPPQGAEKAAEAAYLPTAASIVAAIGRQEGTAALLEAMGKADELNRALMARELVNLPMSPEVNKAFQDAYEKTPLSLSSPLIGGARESLLDKASWFFEGSFVPWLVKTAQDAKGDAADVDPIRQSTLLAAIKLMSAEQLPLVQGLYDTKATGNDGKPTTLGKALEKEWSISKEIVTACGDKVECYLAKLAEPASQAKETVFQGVKSVYMIGVLGSPDVRMKLVELMPKLTSAETRGLAGVVIDHFSPKGDPAIADALQKLIDEAEESKDRNKIANTASLKQVVYRLRARAQ